MSYGNNLPPPLHALEPLSRCTVETAIRSMSKFNFVLLNEFISHLQPYSEVATDYGLIHFNVRYKDDDSEDKKYAELDESILKIVTSTQSVINERLNNNISRFSKEEKENHKYTCKYFITRSIDLSNEDKAAYEIYITYPKELVADTNTLLGKGRHYDPLFMEKCFAHHLNKWALTKKLSSDDIKTNVTHNYFSKPVNVIARLKKALEPKSVTELEEDEDYPLTEKEFVQITVIKGDEKPKVKLYNRFGIKVKEGLSTKEELLKKPEVVKILEAEFSEVEDTPEIKEVETQAPVSLAIKPGYMAERLKRHSELDKETLAKILTCKDARDWYSIGQIDMAIRTYEEYEKTLKKDTPESVVEKVVEETTNTFSTVDTDDEDETNEDEFDDGLEEAMSTTIVNEENDEEEESEEEPEEDDTPVEPISHKRDFYITPTDTRKNVYVAYNPNEKLCPDYITNNTSNKFYEKVYVDVKNEELKFDKIREEEKEKVALNKEDDTEEYELPVFIDEGDEDIEPDEEEETLAAIEEEKPEEFSKPDLVTLNKSDEEAIDELLNGEDALLKKVVTKAAILAKNLDNCAPPAFDHAKLAGLNGIIVSFIKQNMCVDTDLICFDFKLDNINAFRKKISDKNGDCDLLDNDFLDTPNGTVYRFQQKLKELFVRYIEKLQTKRNMAYDTSSNVAVRVVNGQSNGLHVVGGVHVDTRVFSEKEHLGLMYDKKKPYWPVTLKNSIVSCIADFFDMGRVLSRGRDPDVKKKTDACKLISEYVSFNLGRNKTSFLKTRKGTTFNEHIIDRFLKIAGVDFSNA